MKVDEYENRVDPVGASHLIWIYTVCPIVFILSILSNMKLGRNNFLCKLQA